MFIVHGVVDAVAQVLLLHLIRQQMNEHAEIVVRGERVCIVHGQITVTQQQFVQVFP